MTVRPAVPGRVRLFLGGDVMTGRGVDQILLHPGDPAIQEPCLTSARAYVRLAANVAGPIPLSVTDDYVWGDLLAEMTARRPDLRIVNLETAVTVAGTPAPKGINYRMNPDNIGVLKAARLDACCLANNHVLDWGAEGLVETLEVLDRARIAHAGAGRDAAEATRPAILPLPGGGRLLLLAYGAPDAGVPQTWAASARTPGVALVPSDPVAAVERALHGVRRSGDVLVISLHWGENWGTAIPRWHRALAHDLIEGAGAQVVFGHSAHHAKAAEVIGDGLVLYGLGDLVNDYEGIAGQEAYRPDLALAAFVDIDPRGGVVTRTDLVPFRRRRFRLERTEGEDVVRLMKMVIAGAQGPRPTFARDGAIRITA